MRGDLEAFIQEKTEGQGVDIVLEMSGAPTAIKQSRRICRRGGRVSPHGNPGANGRTRHGGRYGI